MRWSRGVAGSERGAAPRSRGAAGSERGAGPSERSTWARGPRLIAVVAAVAVLALGAGVGISRFVISPAELAASAQAPEAGPVTAPIERRAIENTVTTRADVTYADAVEVKPDTSGLGGPAVVTGRVPEVGAALAAGSVALEIAGRPVIVLPGDLPSYRTLHLGSTGPDVLQLKGALVALGIDAGDAASATFDAATAAGLDALYRSVGYESPAASPEARDRVTSARASVSGARSAVDQAVSALDAAGAGPSQAQRVEADNRIRQAQRDLEAATAGTDPALIAAANDALALAYAQREDLERARPTGAEQAAVSAARAQVDEAEQELARAEEEALTVLPSAEVVYLSALPRRVDAVSTERGAVLQGAALTVSGAELVLAGSASESDAALLAVGSAARFEGADGAAHDATVTAVRTQTAPADGSGDEGGGAGGGSGGGGASGRYEVLLAPAALSDAETEALKGRNVRVAIPVQATQGKVLAVPVAALTAGAAGEARIELAPDQPTAGGDGATSTVTVTTGLSAGGYVEIRSDDPRVVEGARVVVGR